MKTEESLSYEHMEAMVALVDRMKRRLAEPETRLHSLTTRLRPDRMTFTYNGQGRAWVFLNPPCNPFAAWTTEDARLFAESPWRSIP